MRRPNDRGWAWSGCGGRGGVRASDERTDAKAFLPLRVLLDVVVVDADTGIAIR